METKIGERAQNLQKFPANSLLAGNLKWETGPIRTVSSASQCGLCGVISGCVKTADFPRVSAQWAVSHGQRAAIVAPGFSTLIPDLPGQVSMYVSCDFEELHWSRSAALSMRCQILRPVLTNSVMPSGAIATAVMV